MADKPQFSVVIPTYNNWASLMECLRALGSQSAGRTSFEIILVNDGGKDDVPENLDLLGHQLSIKYLSQNHRGPAAARNLGIKRATGSIVLLLDDDSLPTEDWLGTTTEAWKRFPDFDGIGGCTLSLPTDRLLCRVNTDIFNWYVRKYSFGDYCTFLSTHNAGYKKDILAKVGLFDERFKGASGEDRDLNIKILKAGGKLRLDEKILVYHDRDLHFRSFLRKFYNYGRAARKLSLRYPGLKRLSFGDYVHFYKSILKKYRKFAQKAAAFALLTLSQLSTLWGYHLAALPRKGGSP
ncbi:MAG: glycosyltransferase family 2 protein [Candidatus Aminicenantes bacterium]